MGCAVNHVTDSDIRRISVKRYGFVVGVVYVDGGYHPILYDLRPPNQSADIDGLPNGKSFGGGICYNNPVVCVLFYCRLEDPRRR